MGMHLVRVFIFSFLVFLLFFILVLYLTHDKKGQMVFPLWLVRAQQSL